MPKGPKGKSPKDAFYHVDRARLKPKRKKLNAAQRKELKAAALQLFVKQPARKAQKRTEPNDRKYDDETQKAVGLMDAKQFYDIISGDSED